MRWTEDNKEIVCTQAPTIPLPFFEIYSSSRWPTDLSVSEDLWNTIFKTQSFHIDLDGVAAAWPGDDKPTPKALKEHLSKYRKSLGGDNKITFGMSAKRTADDGVPVGKPRKKAGAGAAGGTGAGVQKTRAAPKGKGATAAKGRSANSKGKGKAAIKEEVQDEERDEEDTGDVDMDDDEQEQGVKVEFNNEREMFPGVGAEVDSQETLDMPFIKPEPGMEDDFY
ncbi:hypothetical protein ASPCAL04290 [Aspergillus calidoustus]|uniref:Uncharacterized protein n=1 Tax=Aspergillus calidoustus TaxID=454130 RepID=A0A0U5FWX1_ASPCI|nr:hypothetical protein ASPCAL04290 [Aspergillus calidoustus]